MSSQALDLAFLLDCTGTMNDYVCHGYESVVGVIAELQSERIDVHLSLVEYRYHPPPKGPSTTECHPLATTDRALKSWAELCKALNNPGMKGIADALNDLLKMSWRVTSTKMALLFTNSSPDEICWGNSSVNGCPSYHDALKLARQLAQKGIALYIIGDEPSLPQHRDFYTVLAHAAAGRYVPLSDLSALSKVILHTIQEEMSLGEAREVVTRYLSEEKQRNPLYFNSSDGYDNETQLTRNAHLLLEGKGSISKEMVLPNMRGLPFVPCYVHTNLASCADLPKMITACGVFDERISPLSSHYDLVSYVKGGPEYVYLFDTRGAAADGGRMYPRAAAPVYEIQTDTVTVSQTMRLVRRAMAQMPILSSLPASPSHNLQI